MSASLAAVHLIADFPRLRPRSSRFGFSDKTKRVFNVPELADWLADWVPAIGLKRAYF